MKKRLLLVGLLLAALLIGACSQKSVTAVEPETGDAVIETKGEKVVPGGGPLPSTLGEDDRPGDGGP